MELNIAHIINPILDTHRPDLQYIQAITFKSIKNALKYSQNSNNTTKCNIFSTQYSEDHPSIPSFVHKLSDLKQSVLDVHPELKGKKLPLIKDILEIALTETNADYIIYTNIDIALQPYFYEYVENKIKEGHDAIVINRRRIAFELKSMEFIEEDLVKYYGELGRSHPGFDCFVLKREIVESFILNHICIGISFLETSLIHNIAAFSENPFYALDQHLTFHLGTEVLVPRKKNPFYWHNRNIFFNEIQPQLKDKWKSEHFPYGDENFFKRSIGWGLNPSLFSRNFLELEGKGFKQRLKMQLDEIRWRILQK